MTQPRNRLPKQENERIITETLRRAHLIFTSLLASSAAASSTAGVTPTLIPAGQTVTVAANTQMLFAETIVVAGSLVLEGSLIMVN